MLSTPYLLHLLRWLDLSPNMHCPAKLTKTTLQLNALDVHRDFSADDVIVTANAQKASRLQAMSAACGRIYVPKARSQVTLSVAGTADDNSTECQKAAQLVQDGMLLHAASLSIVVHAACRTGLVIVKIGASTHLCVATHRQ